MLDHLAAAALLDTTRRHDDLAWSALPDAPVVATTDPTTRFRQRVATGLHHLAALVAPPSSGSSWPATAGATDRTARAVPSHTSSSTPSSCIPTH